MGVPARRWFTPSRSCTTDTAKAASTAFRASCSGLKVKAGYREEASEAEAVARITGPEVLRQSRGGSPTQVPVGALDPRAGQPWRTSPPFPPTCHADPAFVPRRSTGR